MSISDFRSWMNRGSSISTNRQCAENRLLDLQGRLDLFFDEFFTQLQGLPFFTSVFSDLGDFSPRMNLSETDKKFILSPELPGMDPEEVDISLDGSILKISGEKRAEQEDKGKRYYRLERFYSSFQREIKLPSQVDKNKIKATLKKDMLEMRLPKTKEAQQKKKSIPIINS